MEPLLGLELTTDRQIPTTSQTRYRLRHAAPYFLPDFVAKLTL